MPHGSALRLRATDAVTGRLSVRLARATIQIRTVIMLAFTLILLVSGGGLVWIDHRAALGSLKRQVDQRFDILAQSVTSRVAVQFDSADAVLDTLAMDPPPLDDPERAGTVLARVLAELRRTSPAVKSLVAADASGRYILAEHVFHRGEDEPEPTAYHLRVGSVTDGRSSETLMRLDRGFGVLSRTDKPTPSYDPRSRPWYAQAAGTPKAVTTPRYLFSGGDHYGFTMSRRAYADPGRVFGIDVRLDSLSATLHRALTFSGEHIAIFDEGGALLGDSDRLTLVDPLGSASAREATRRVAGGRGLAIDEAVYDAYRRDPKPQNLALDVDGHAVYANLTPFSVNGTAMVVASSVPARLFEAPALRLLLWSLALQIGIVVAAGILAAVASRFISRPIGALASDVERITAFDFPDRSRGASRIREIQRLLAAVDLLELTLRTLSTYLPHRFARDLLERGSIPSLGGRRLPVIVMFSDIDGFTGIAEAMAPDVLMPQLSRYFTAIGEEVLTSGGTLDKFTGDGVMAFWPLPEDEPSRAADVCRAVLRAASRVDALNAAFAAEGRPTFTTRFGLHAGEAMVGSVGMPERMNYTAIGHTVNVASRIEQLNKAYGTRVLVSMTMREATGDAARFRHVDAAAVRGAQASTDVYELLPDVGAQADPDEAGPHK